MLEDDAALADDDAAATVDSAATSACGGGCDDGADECLAADGASSLSRTGAAGCGGEDAFIVDAGDDCIVHAEAAQRHRRAAGSRAEEAATLASRRAAFQATKSDVVALLHEVSDRHRERALMAVLDEDAADDVENAFAADENIIDVDATAAAVADADDLCL
jgi:hypothetical protein